MRNFTKQEVAALVRVSKSKLSLSKAIALEPALNGRTAESVARALRRRGMHNPGRVPAHPFDAAIAEAVKFRGPLSTRSIVQIVGCSRDTAIKAVARLGMRIADWGPKRTPRYGFVARDVPMPQAKPHIVSQREHRVRSRIRTSLGPFAAAIAPHLLVRR